MVVDGRGFLIFFFFSQQLHWAEEVILGKKSGMQETGAKKNAKTHPWRRNFLHFSWLRLFFLSPLLLFLYREAAHVDKIEINSLNSEQKTRIKNSIPWAKKRNKPDAGDRKEGISLCIPIDEEEEGESISDT